MRTVMVVALLLLAGCAQPSETQDEPGVSTEQPTPQNEGPVGGSQHISLPANESLTLPCGSCFEPTLAVSNGSLFLTAGSYVGLFVRENGTWVKLPAPEVPGLEGAAQGDIFIQSDANDRLWWHSMVDPRVNNLKHATMVARSDDGGKSWPVVKLLYWVADQGIPLDRQWLAVEGDTVVATCMCPLVGLPQMRISYDAGETFSAPKPIQLHEPLPGPMGPILRLNGTMVAPFLTGFSTANGNIGAHHAAAVFSMDDGDSWSRVDFQPFDTRPLTCCAFPNGVVQGTAFRITWTDGAQGYYETRSEDAVSWTTTHNAENETHYPHAWPVQGTDAVVWAGDGERGTDVLVSQGGETIAIGAVDTTPGDYMHGVAFRNHIATAWPENDSLTIGYVPIETKLG